MKLELALEMRRLKMVEDQLAVLQREAAELCDAMIVDTQEGNPTATLRLMLDAIQEDVRSALADWDALKSSISLTAGAPERRQRRYRG